MADFRWREAGEVIEHYLPRWGRSLIKATMVCGALFVIGIGHLQTFVKFAGYHFKVRFLDLPVLPHHHSGSETGRGIH